MIIVNFATKEYRRGQERLKASLNGHKSLFFTDYPPGSPSHKESPYEFKIHAIEKAFEQDDLVLWMDSSMYVVGDLDIIENIIKKDGYFMEEAGHYVDHWCNDHARKYFNLAHGSGYTMFSAGLLGLNLKSEVAMEFFYKWKASAKAGCFKGDWSNHRHDMTSASIISSRMGMKYQRGGEHMAYIGPGYSEPEKNAVIHLQGI
jgi:hypothetical protein